jgi:DNA-binding MarR family transcriptional regulator
VDVDPAELPLTTLAELAGAAVNAEVQRRLLDRGYGELKVSYGYVVQLLLDVDPPVGEVALSLGVSQQAASKTIVEMEARGLVERYPDADDARIRRVRLTARGREAVDAARAIRAELHDALGLSPAERDAARTALIRLLDLAGGTDAIRRRRVRPIS